MRLIGHRFKIIALWISAVCLTLVVLLFALSIIFYFILIYPPVQERALRFAEAQVEDIFSGKVTIERLESNLLSYVDLYGVRGVGTSGYGDSNYVDSIYVGHVTARYWVPALARKRLRVTSVQVTDVRAHVVMDPGNEIRIPFIPAEYYDSSHQLEAGFDAERKHGAERTSADIPNPANWKWQVDLGRARVNGINAVYRDLSNHMVGEISGASATARFHTLDSFSVELRVPEGAYRSPWWSGEIDTIAAAGVITWKGLEVSSLLLKGSGTHVTGGGRLSYFSDGPWDLSADFITNLKPLPVIYENVPGLGKDGYLEGRASFGGTLYKPVYAAQVSGYGVTYSGYRVGTLMVDAGYGRDEYGHARVRGLCDFGKFDITASILMKSLMRGPEFGDYSVFAVLNDLDAKRVSEELKLKLPLPIDAGQVRVKASGACFDIPSAVSVTAELAGEKLAGEAISVNADLKGSAWNLDGSWGANRVSGRGSVNPVKGTLKGAVSADVSDPSVASTTFAGERVMGRVAASADFEGRFDDPSKFSVSANVKGEEIRWRGMLADSLEAVVTLQDGKFQLQRADCYVAGMVDSIAAFFGQKGVGGYIEADVSMKGGFDAPLANARLRARNLRYGEYSLDTVSGFASMEDNTVRWNNLYLRGMGASLHSSGRFRFGDEMELAADVYLINEANGAKKDAGKLAVNGTMRGDTIAGSCRVASVPLDLFDQWLPEEHRLKGVMTLNADFSGTLSNPAARLTFQLTKPSYAGHSAHSLIGNALLIDSIVSAAALLRKSERAAAIEARGLLPLLPSSGWKIDETGKRFALISAHTEKFDLAEVKEYIGDDVGVSGAVSFDLRLTNNGSGWTTGGRVSLPDARLRYEEQNITVSGVNLNASVSGPVEDPRVNFTLSSGSAEMPPLRMDKCVIRGHSGLDTLVVDSARFTFRDSGFVDASVKILYSGADSLFYNRNLFARYKIINLPTSLFNRLMPGFRLRNGIINAMGYVYGDDGRPLLSGALALNGLDLVFPDINPTIGPVDAMLRFADSTVEITSLTAKVGRGQIRAAGYTVWNGEGIHGTDLRINASNLQVELPEVVNAGVQSAALRISDRSSEIVVDGKVTLGQTSYVRDVNFIEMINNMQVSADVRRAPNPFLQTIRLRIDLDLANNMNIDMNLGALTMDGRLTVGGTAGDPGIVGEIKIRDGYVYYLDRKFNISDGSIFNPDLTAINPNLRIIAKSDVSTYSPNNRAEQFVITLSITGTLETPVVRFTSEPALSELDILSILTLGERLGGMGSDINNRLMNIAAQQAIGIGARRLEKLLNLDRVSVTGDVLGSGGSQSAGATIGVTKRITSGLNVTYETNMGKLSDRKVTAQYRILPNLYLEGQTTSGGENALDLIFRFSR